MKALLISISILVLALAGCVSNPSVTVTNLDGTTMKLSTGVNLMAEVDEQVSEVKGHGWDLKHVVKRQDATRVPIAGIQAAGAYGGAYLNAASHDLETTTNGATELGKQGVTKFTEGEKTKRILGTFVAPKTP